MFIVADEFAHFNKSAQSTRDKPLDHIIYEALMPSVSGFRMPDSTGNARMGAAFGKGLFLSSPNGKQGKFYEDFQNAIEHGPDSYCLAIQCATWEVNPIVAPSFLKGEFNKNTASYDQEYGAKFTAGGVNWLRDLPTFYASLDTRLDPLQPVGRRDRVYFLGVDFALSNDGTACSICHWEPNFDEDVDSFDYRAYTYLQETNPFHFEDPAYDLFTPRTLKDPEFLASLQRPRGRFVVDYTEVRYAGRPPYENRKVLLIEEVLDWIEDLYFRWPIKYGVYDQWSGEIIKQLLEKRGLGKRLEMIKFNETNNDAMYKLFSSLLHGHQVKFPAEETLINELLSLRVELRAHGVIKVEVPNGAGHDDRFDSLARALFLAHGFKNNNNVLAGQTLQHMFNNINPVSTTVSFDGIADQRKLQILQRMHHQAQLSIRSPNLRSNKVMPRR